jgi:hypothetical protein
MKQTAVYIYVMTNDSGFAPCIQNNWLTLACCKGGIKGGMRKSAAKEFQAGKNVYLLGLCGKTLARETAYLPVYLAKVDEVIDMIDYYADDGRAAGRQDNVYRVENGELIAKANNPHSDYCRAKDLGGQYVLCSHQFTYWGNKCGTSGTEIEQEYSELFASIRKRNSFRGHIVFRENHFIETAKTWSWFPKQTKHCNVISKRSIKGDLISGRKC